jgi:hypothetical protein
VDTGFADAVEDLVFAAQFCDWSKTETLDVGII